MIARERQCAFTVVPHSEMEHAVEARQAFSTPLCKSSQQHFRICLSPELMAFALQLFAQLAIVVDLAPEGNDVTTVSGKHWLMTRYAGVDDCQTAMTQTRAPRGGINAFGSPTPVIVAATMLD